ncbi:MAG TPA: methylmalonyl-CoA epimerase [Candidatus Limnocylindrales bacterium]|nr:methylmalonyl-CoA epimerase [Candidatus Limnocylindrales bacterium]
MSPVLGLAHVGIAVRSIDAAIPIWVNAFGMTHTDTIEFEPMQLRIAFLRSGSSEVELLEPLASDSPVGRFLAKRGEGIHHLSFDVPDLEAAITDAAAAGLELIDKTPREGSHHTRIAFLSPRTLNGVLVELCERRKK